MQPCVPLATHPLFLTLPHTMNSNLNQNTSMKEVLIYAAENGQSNLLIAALELGADPNSTTHFDNSALLNAAYYGQSDCVKLLLRAGANADHVNDMGETPIMMAAKNGHVECVRLLKPYSHEYEMRDDEGKTVFDYAAEQGNVEILRLLNEPDTEPTYTANDMPVYDSAAPYEELVQEAKDHLRTTYFTQKDMDRTPLL